MKKKFLILLSLTIISMFFVVSCGKNKVEADKNSVETPRISTNDLKSMFPYTKGVELTYTSEKNTITAKVKELANNSITIEHGETSKIEFSNEGIKLNNDLILKMPVEKNATWDSSKGKVTITNINYIIETALGNIETIEVSIENGNKYYIAKNLGIVKIITKKDNKEISYELTNINSPKKETPPTEKPEDDKPKNEAKVSKVYYYDVVEDTMVYVPVKKATNVNDKTAPSVFEGLFKNSPNSDISPLMPSTTKINSIKVNKAKSTVTIDVSEAFTESMNLGSSGELGALNGIACTLGDAYKCKNVVITVNGNSFSTGHSEVSANSPLKVNTSGAKELK